MCTLTHTIKTNARIMSSTIILKFKGEAVRKLN